MLEEGDPRLRPHPFAFLLMLLLFFSGISVLFADAEPQSFEALLPGWALIAWGVGLTLGSLFGIIGFLGAVFKRYRGLVWEQVGSAWMGAAIFFYGSCVALFAGVKATMVIALCLVSVAMCLWNVRRIQTIIRDAELTVSARQVVIDE